MTYFTKPHRRSRATEIELLLSGAATITFDQSMGKFKLRSTGDALAADWRAVGRDMKRALASAEG